MCTSKPTTVTITVSGPPGSGKSTIAEAVLLPALTAAGVKAVLVGHEITAVIPASGITADEATARTGGAHALILEH